MANCRRIVGMLVAVVVVRAALGAPAAQAGCGCEKPPPQPAQVRPAVTYPGMTVTLFGAPIVAGSRYTVTFASGVDGTRVSAPADAVLRRDLADGVMKPQIQVALPELPLGPASISVWAAGSGVVVSVPDSAFTVAPTAVPLPQGYGEFHAPAYRAAVGRDGVVYLAFDVTGITAPTVFDARAEGYPLRFGYEDVVFHNVQGYLMQSLISPDDPKHPAPMPGMFVFPATSLSSSSDSLRYSRHEFDSYFLQHAERQPHAVDPTDPNWHVAGDRHIDHDHLILAIDGLLDGGGAPAPGATPSFDLVVTASSLFSRGATGISSAAMSGSATVDSYDPDSGQTTWNGDVFTNGKLSMSGSSVIFGDASASSFSLHSNSAIRGATSKVTTAETFMSIKVPAGLPELGVIDLNGTGMTIRGPGSFKVASLAIKFGGRLYVDNAAGPVTLYVLGGVTISGGGVISAADPDPEKLAVYVASDTAVSLTGDRSVLTGVLYAPGSTVSISGEGEFYGAFVGKAMRLSNQAHVHFYEPLARP